MTDQQLRDRLQDIDESETIRVSAWEAKFLESVVYRYHGPLSDKQRETAEKIIDKYGA